MPRTLQLHSTGDDVAFLQAQLNTQPPTALPPLVISPNFDAATQARVLEYQTNTELPVDGVAGPVTWGSLLGHPTIETRGFFVLGRNLYDRLGNRVIPRGVNKMSVFDGEDPVGSTCFPEIKKTGANSVRIVWAITTNLTAGGPATSLETLDSLIANAKASHLIPLVELHDATGDWPRLPELVDYWTKPEITAVLQSHEAYVLVNIGNEVGDELVTQAQFTEGYSNAVLQMRAAGIHAPLVIDASGWGQDLNMLNATAASLLAADPDYNLVFSVHLYWSLACGSDGARIRTELGNAAALGYPLIVGEFSKYGGFPCGFPAGTSICSPGGEIDYRTIISSCHDLDIGWYAWEWGPGNGFNDPLCNIMDMTPDRRFANLKPGWAEEVAIGSPFSIRNTAVTPPSI